MKAVDVELMVSEWLNDVAGHANFVRADGGEYFIRHSNGCRQAFGMAIWDRTPTVELSLLVSVRLDPVEEVFHLFSGSPEAYQYLSDTIVTSINYFAGGPSRVKVSHPEELSSILSEWEMPVRDEILPYLDLAQSVIELDRVVNVDRDVLDIIHPPHSFMHHAILAKLASNPNFEQLVLYQKSMMSDIGCDQAVYDRLIDHLRQASFGM